MFKMFSSHLHHVILALQGVSALGLCLIFGGYLKHVRKLSDELEPVYHTARKRWSTGFKARTSDKDMIMALTGHLESGSYDLVLGGSILFILSAVALLVLYKGRQRIVWMLIFVMTILAVSSGHYLHKAADPDKWKDTSLKGSDFFESDAKTYLVMVSIANLMSLICIIAVKIFDHHGKLVRMLSKLFFWAGFNMATLAYLVGCVRFASLEGPFSIAKTFMILGFSSMMILGTYAVVSELIASRKLLAGEQKTSWIV